MFEDKYDECVRVQNHLLSDKLPAEVNSLYHEKKYNTQTANRRCHERYPVQIKEGFSQFWCWSYVLRVLLFITLLAVIGWFAYDLSSKPVKKIDYKVESVSPVSSINISALPNK